MYEMTVPVFTKLLGNLSRCMDKAQKYAEAKKFDVNVLAEARLAPDQYSFIEQIQSTCDAAKFACARLTGKEPPKHEDNETTFEELHQRIQKVVTYLKTYSPDDFKNCEERPVKLPYFEGKSIVGHQYFTSMALPNFYFHYTTAYSILRHNGVDVGKTDYIGEIKFMEQ
jgi:hypothetical protein